MNGCKQIKMMVDGRLYVWMYYGQKELTVESRVLTRGTIIEKNNFFAKKSQYISIENPLHKQSEKACMCF